MRLKLRFLGDEAALGDAISVGDEDRTREQEIGDRTREQAMGLKPERKAGVRLIYLDSLAMCVECLTHEHDALRV